jgi:hypothetical protein
MIVRQCRRGRWRRKKGSEERHMMLGACFQKSKINERSKLVEETITLRVKSKVSSLTLSKYLRYNLKRLEERKAGNQMEKGLE